MDLLLKLFIVAITAASPIGEILIAIGVGVALGVNPFLSFLISFPSNMAPAALILSLLDAIEKRYPSVFKYFSKRGETLIKRFGNRKTQIVIALITPIAGVYAMSFATKFIGVGKKTSFLWQSIGVALYGIVEALLINFGISFR